MDINAILIAVAVIAFLGLFIGLFLGIAGDKLKVEEDERIGLVESALPGNNCGGCGYAGCSAMAKAIVEGAAPVNGCPVGGEKVAKNIAEIMGVDSGESVRLTAFVKCNGDCEKATKNYTYSGVKDCRMLAFVPGKGEKACSYGCLGYGTCVKECPFDAIHIVDGIAKVDKERCKACGKCVAICPKNLIELIPYDAAYSVACSSKDKGPDAMKNCKVSCIGCGLCKKNCPVEAVEVTDFLAKIDYDLCQGCGACAEKCPKKAIVKN